MAEKENVGWRTDPRPGTTVEFVSVRRPGRQTERKYTSPTPSPPHSLGAWAAPRQHSDSGMGAQRRSGPCACRTVSASCRDGRDAGDEVRLEWRRLARLPGGGRRPHRRRLPPGICLACRPQLGGPGPQSVPPWAGEARAADHLRPPRLGVLGPILALRRRAAGVDDRRSAVRHGRRGVGACRRLRDAGVRHRHLDLRRNLPGPHPRADPLRRLGDVRRRGHGRELR